MAKRRRAQERRRATAVPARAAMPAAGAAWRVPGKTTLAILTLGLLLTLPGLVPGAERLPHRPHLDWQTVASAFALRLPIGPAPPDPVVTPKTVLKTAKPRREALPAATVPAETSTPVPFLHLPPGALDAFFGSLRRTEEGGPEAVTNVLHYGDSPTTADLITADVRRLLQRRFGDAGHGFVLLAKPWAWYAHDGVEIDARGWTVEAASQSYTRNKDGRYGLGGVSLRGDAGARSELQIRPGHTAVEVAFERSPAAGEFELMVEGQEPKEVDTHGEEGPGFAVVSLPAGAESVSVRVTRGPVRLFGARLTKGQTGIAYHSLGLNGAGVVVPAQHLREDAWAAHLQHYRPALVILNYGTNESLFAEYVESQYRQELRKALKRLRTAVPVASALLMSPMDRGVKDENGDIVTPAALERVVDIQREVAEEAGVAFYDTFHAMGGRGTMGRWQAAQPRLVGADLLHPMPAGARTVGEGFYRALLEAYEMGAP